MEIKHVYVKERCQFGRQCFFEDVGPIVEEDIAPNERLRAQYMRRTYLHCGEQKSDELAMHEVQTMRKNAKSSGMFHVEGSWPKEMNFRDEEAVRRFRRRAMKLDTWYPCVSKLVKIMEHYVLQNAAVDIHNYYFDDMVASPLTVPCFLRCVQTYLHPETNTRPVSHISWTADGTRMAVAYCYRNGILLPPEVSPNSYIWNVESPNQPLLQLNSDTPSIALEFNPRDPSLLVSGLTTGQVCSWDIRMGNSPVKISNCLTSHRNPASRVLWISSKSNTEFFSSSSCGTVRWWDTRNMREPTDIVVMDLEDPRRADMREAVGITSLHYEPTIGTKFLAGLENGMLLNVNRKVISETEKLSVRYECHPGPILNIDRNPYVSKYFLTVDDWSAKVWSIETRENSLVRTRESTCRLTGACWSLSRCSVFFTVGRDGTLRAYDLSVGMKDPLKLRVSQTCLTVVEPHTDGELLAIGSDDGKVFFVRCSEGLVESTKEDRANLVLYLDKCSRFEKQADLRQKELRATMAHVPTLSKMEIEVPKAREKERERKKDRSKDRSRAKDAAKGKEDGRRRSKLRKFGIVADSVELVEAEKEYFRQVETEREKYATEEDSDMKQVLAAIQEEKKRILKEKELEKKGKKAIKAKEEKKKKKKRRRPPRKVSILRSGEAPPSRKEFDVTFVVEDDYAEKSDEEDEGRKRRRGRSPKSKVCEAAPCEPDICCMDTVEAFKAKIREAAIARNQRKVEESARKKSLLRLDVSSMEKRKWLVRLSDLVKRMPERSIEQKKRILIAKDAEPDILKREVRKAKKRIGEWQESVSAGKYEFEKSRSTDVETKGTKLKKGESDRLADVAIPFEASEATTKDTTKDETKDTTKMT